MNESLKYLVGTAFIKTDWTLEATAARIAKGFSIPLEQAPVGRFEEYEGYQCEILGFYVTLLGQDPFAPHDSTYTYEFHVLPGHHLKFPPDASVFEEDNISSFLVWALSSIADWEVSPDGR